MAGNRWLVLTPVLITKEIEKIQVVVAPIPLPSLQVLFAVN